MVRAGIVAAVLLCAGVGVWLFHGGKKTTKEPEPTEWTLPASAGQKVVADAGGRKDLLPESLRGEEPAEAGTEGLPVARVGEIIIKGNGKTNAKLILERVPLAPGKVLFYSDLVAAEQKLAATGLFVVDPAKGIRPTVEVVEELGGSLSKNIIIHVQEK